MDHMPWLLERGADAGGEPCGHALMASCPPEPFPELTPDIPFGYSNIKNEDTKSGQRTWELSKGDLATLLSLSEKLNLDGEITPVMAWGMVLAHPRLSDLSPPDFRKLTEELGEQGPVLRVSICPYVVRFVALTSHCVQIRRSYGGVRGS